MNFAILAPSPHRFVMGGAEHFWLGLQRYINECTSHTCELVKVPTSESNLTDLIQAYRMHAQVDLGGYDRVITSKYPAWMVSHPHHAVYMLHTLRGLYDTYHFMREPLDVAWPAELDWLRQEIGLLAHAPVHDNSAVLRLLDTVQAGLQLGRVPPDFARFPGPFSRHLVHALDRFSMQPARIRSYTAISKTVAARRDYFPAGVDIQVVYPPPRLEDFRCGSDDYLFTVSRLDGPKRIGLLIEAMRHVRADIPLLIGGTGPEEQRLRELAQGDTRIKFLGALTDEQLLDGYANALAVPFVPYDEDYGLITIEAMRSGKPVLTVHDAGGVTEFVQHGVTGLCVAPEPLALASAIEELCSDRTRTRSMGIQARKLVQGISWRPLAERVMGVTLPRTPVARRKKQQAASRRPKAVVALTFAVTPPRGGGQSRVFHLYKSLASSMDIVLVCLCNSGVPELKHEIAPGLWEIRVPKSAAHQDRENEASRGVNWVPVTDIVASSEIQHTPRFLQALDQECMGTDFVISSHPFLTSTLRSRYPAIPLWFEIHNVELTLKKGMLPENDASSRLLGLVESEEGLAWREASVVYACAQQDLDTMQQRYGPTSAEIFEVPNGFAEEDVVFSPPLARAQTKELLTIGRTPMVLFLGSWHGPNLEAAERVLAYAQAIPHALFVIVGSAGLYFSGRIVPKNVRLVGAVDVKEKQVFLAAADIAINPMSSGSGSNLKMLDYFAAGVPVLSTPFGARGIDALPDVHYLSSSIEDFLPTLVQTLLIPERLATLAEAANNLAREQYSWNAIGARALSRLSDHIA